MTLDEILASRRPQILRRWLELMYTLCPPETRGFLANERDPFANPVGQTLREAADELYERVCHPGRPDACPALENLMRLHAVQGIAPSQAVAFLLALKRLLRAEINVALQGPTIHLDLETLDDRIDMLTLQAVDLFATYREQLAVLQVREARRGTAKLIERLQRERPTKENR